MSKDRSALGKNSQNLNLIVGLECPVQIALDIRCHDLDIVDADEDPKQVPLVKQPVPYFRVLPYKIVQTLSDAVPLDFYLTGNPGMLL